MHRFSAILDTVDGNPFVAVPPEMLQELFVEADKDTSPIPVRGSINDVPFTQTLMKFRGAWRLYVNMKMLKDSPRRIGEELVVELRFDPSDRTIPPHPKLLSALDDAPEAKEVFQALSPSRQKEIVRYIDALKSEDKVDLNITRAIEFLLGNGRFVGRDSP